MTVTHSHHPLIPVSSPSSSSSSSQSTLPSAGPPSSWSSNMILLGSILILQFFIFIVVIVFPSPVFSPLVTDASGSYLRPDGSPAFLAARSQSPYPYKWLEHVQGTGVIARQSERIILTPKQAETTNPISASSTTPSSTGSAASSSPEQTPAPTPAPLPKSKHVPSGNGEVIFATDATFDNEVKSNDDELVFVEFFAPWCGHCQRLAPEYKKAAAAAKGIAKFVAVDATIYKALANKHNVRGYPTLFLFRPHEKHTPEKYSQPGRKANDLVDFVTRAAFEVSQGITLLTKQQANKLPEPSKEQLDAFYREMKDFIIPPTNPVVNA